MNEVLGPIVNVSFGWCCANGMATCLVVTFGSFDVEDDWYIVWVLGGWAKVRSNGVTEEVGLSHGLTLGLGVVVGSTGLMGGEFGSKMLMSSVSLNNSMVESLKNFGGVARRFLYFVLIGLGAETVENLPMGFVVVAAIEWMGI